MYVDRSTLTLNGKKHTRVLLRESRRVNGKVTKTTVANISHLAPTQIRALALALRCKDASSLPLSGAKDIELRQGTSLGAIWLLKVLAERLGLTEALGTDRQGTLALLQVIARTIWQGSRLSMTRLSGSHAIGECLGVERFNEEHLYANLQWLCDNQRAIEDALFRSRYPGQQKPELFLYDVTSSYFEGDHNALGLFGYNRDKKGKKLQIVIGLLCDQEGWPLSVEVFPGNTSDPKTVSSQIQKIARRFGGGQVTLVGDRGMIKSQAIEEVTGMDMHYITAITKPQIEKLLAHDVLDMSLFDSPLAEVTSSEEPLRYILRRNPQRAEEIAANRLQRLAALQTALAQANLYLRDHPKAKPSSALKKLQLRNERLGLASWVCLEVRDREVVLLQDPNQLAQASKLDGCYCLKTDLPQDQAPKEQVHENYKSLALVEQAFRTSKTVQLELRPIFVQTEASTRGHVLVVMLAYQLARELQKLWKNINLTVQEGLQALEQLCLIEVSCQGSYAYTAIPKPRPDIAELLREAKVSLPVSLDPKKKIHVATKKKLQTNRK